jgi:hypothetical protein
VPVRSDLETDELEVLVVVGLGTEVPLCVSCKFWPHSVD